MERGNAPSSSAPSLQYPNTPFGFMYSFSTCWNSHRHTDGRAMLREIRELGFACAELSHGTRISLLPGILEAVDAGEIRISSLHNFCPLPIGRRLRRAQSLSVLCRAAARARDGRALHDENPRMRRARQGPCRRAAPRQHRDEELHRQAAGHWSPAAKRTRPSTPSCAPTSMRSARPRKDPLSSASTDRSDKLLPEADVARPQAGHRKPPGARRTAAR